LEISPFKSADETRYYLAGFALENYEGGVKLIATDGYVCLLSHNEGAQLDKDGEQVPIVNLPKDFLVTINNQLKKYKYKPSNVRLVIDGNQKGNAATIILIDPDLGTVEQAKEIVSLGAKSKSWLGAVGNVLIDGTFPDYKRIIPQGSPQGEGAVQAYNHVLMSKFGKLSTAKEGGLCIFAAEKGDPGLVSIQGRDDLLGVIMPLKSVGFDSLSKAAADNF